MGSHLMQRQSGAGLTQLVQYLTGLLMMLPLPRAYSPMLVVKLPRAFWYEFFPLELFSRAVMYDEVLVSQEQR